MKNLWDQNQKEASKAFSVFLAYRDLGLRRSCNAVATQLNMNPSSVLELSKRHNWQERVRAWDTYLDQETQLNQINQIKEMKERQINLALNAQEVASRGLKSLLASNTTFKPDSLSKLLDTGCRLERLNRDEPEQNLEVLNQSKFDNLSLEEMEILRNLLDKAQTR